MDNTTRQIAASTGNGPFSFPVRNKNVIDFVSEAYDLASPDSIVWIDGSEAQLDLLRNEGVSTGEMIRLNQDLMPGCYYHRSVQNDVARVEGRTYICCENEIDAGPTNNWMAPDKAYSLARDIMKNSMKGRTMYVIPFVMGPLESPFAKVGIEITDSIYVVLNMAIMTRAGKDALKILGDTSNDFVRGFHGKCDIDPEKRYILHFPQDNAIWSMNSGYGGNALLGKKCFALRIASTQGLREGWMAEHMLILGIEAPDGEMTYIAAAFPSACGKTNLAMVIPPEYYQKKGYKVHTLGDDIAWLRIKEDGRLYAINPEAGFFGVAPGTGMKSNPNAVMATSKNTIFTNVVLNTENNTVWWEGLNKTPPENALDWTGKPWDPSSGVKGAHPNSRFTAPAKNCPCISPEWESPEGVPISAIIFGGRRAKTAPLVCQARDWTHGVFLGSVLTSEKTAAAEGQVGEVRIDPMAMIPFIGYNAGDYFNHWLEMGKKMKNPPKIFQVNWFRTNDNGAFIWPGFGDNLRVLQWVVARCKGTVDARDAKVGAIPYPEDIDINELDYEIEEGVRFGRKDLEEILRPNYTALAADLPTYQEFYNKIGAKLPKELSECLETFKSTVKS